MSQRILNTLIVAMLLKMTTTTASIYAFGDDCKSLTSGECSLVQGCTQCAMSWPTFSSEGPDSKWAKCRCKNPDQGDAEDAGTLLTHYFGDDCDSLTEGRCSLVSGCTRC